MIKNFKVFEKDDILPKIGDYVVLDSDKFIDFPDLISFLSNNFGTITDIRRKYSTRNHFYDVKFETTHNIYLNMDNEIVRLVLEDFEYWSSDLDEVEAYLNLRRYNL